MNRKKVLWQAGRTTRPSSRPHLKPSEMRPRDVTIEVLLGDQRLLAETMEESKLDSAETIDRFSVLPGELITVLPTIEDIGTLILVAAQQEPKQ